MLVDGAPAAALAEGHRLRAPGATALICEALGGSFGGNGQKYVEGFLLKVPYRLK